MSQLSKRVATSLTVLVVGAGIALGWMHRYDLHDWWFTRSYTPTSVVAAIATDTTMRPKTAKMFYAYHPSLEDRQQFNEHCSKDGEKGIVLGCYNQIGIYIYNVTDSRLNGVVQATAAHEMLHAAYDRLGRSEKRHVNQMVQAAYDKVTDSRIRETIQNYQDAGADVPNELHSIIGTEVAGLSPELESYYSRYFVNRQAVVAFTNQYESEFTSRKQKVIEDDAKLATMKQRIDAMEADLATRRKALDAGYQQLQNLKRAKEISTYNAAVVTYNQQVNDFNATIAQLQQLIDEHNNLVIARNALQVETTELAQAIDSHPSAVSSQ